MNWKRWNWVSEAMLPATLAVQRTCWLWLWLEFARRWLAPSYHRALLPASLILGLSLTSMATARWTPAGTRVLSRARLQTTLIGFGAILLVLWWQFYRGRYPLWNMRWMGILGTDLTHWGAVTPPLFIALVIAIYLWLRGLLDGRMPPIHDNVWGAFTTGFIMLVILVVVAMADRRGLPTGAEHVIVLFFATSMAALALSSLEMGRGVGRRRIGARLQLSRHWLVSMLSIILGLLGIGLAISALIAPADVARVLGWIGGVVNAIGRVIYTVIAFLSYLLYLILYPLFVILIPLVEWLAALLGKMFSLDSLQELEAEELDAPEQLMTLSEPARWALLIVTVLVLGLIFAMALQRVRLETEEEIEEERDLILSRELLRTQWKALWHRWIQRLRGMRRTVLHPFLSLEDEIHTRRVIRAIYQALLATARDQGCPRRRGQTPIEYRRALARLLPGAQDALNAITDGYVHARYSPEPPTVEQMEGARRAWEEIQSTWQAEPRTSKKPRHPAPDS